MLSWPRGHAGEGCLVLQASCRATWGPPAERKQPGPLMPSDWGSPDEPRTQAQYLTACTRTEAHTHTHAHAPRHTPSRSEVSALARRSRLSRLHAAAPQQPCSRCSLEPSPAASCSPKKLQCQDTRLRSSPRPSLWPSTHRNEGPANGGRHLPAWESPAPALQAIRLSLPWQVHVTERPRSAPAHLYKPC